jgi:hypothetical protein
MTYSHTISQLQYGFNYVCNKFYGIDSSGLYNKIFMIIIYDCNDNDLYYKTTIVANLTMIIANLALARNVNYYHKVRCKLKRTLMIVNYNPKPFIVQTPGCKIRL